MVQLAKNRIMKNEAGPPLQGSALLQGIVICGKCGSRMRTQYQRQGEKKVQYYCCHQEAQEFGGNTCQNIHGVAVDHALSEIIIDKLTPTAILKAIDVQRELEHREASSDNYYAMRVESARYKAELARKRFTKVDPDNRLVAFELERLWNQSLEELASAEDEHRRCLLSKERAITKDDTESLLALPEDVKALWDSEDISIDDRKRIARCIIKNVTLLKKDGKINIGVCFKAGSSEELVVDNPLRPYERHVLPESTLDIIRNEAIHHNADKIVRILNGLGLKTATGLEFTDRIVQKTMRSHGIPTCEKWLKQQGYITLPDKAKLLDIPWQKLYQNVISGVYDGKYDRAGEKGKFMFL